MIDDAAIADMIRRGRHHDIYSGTDDGISNTHNVKLRV